MQTTSSFKIYDAAAGSGKTFTLVKAYLTTLLIQDNPFHFQKLLALTFTNKAVAEMKERILSNLVAFADNAIVNHPTPMASVIVAETGLEINALHNKSNGILKALLNNYAAFAVETIDSFNHRIIRTFAKDLKLPPNFELVLDTEALLLEAVESVIDKTGEDPAITKVLIDYTIEKAYEDTSWDITRDIYKAATLLESENDAQQISLLKEATLEDFASLKKQLQKTQSQKEKQIIATANNVAIAFEAVSITQAIFGTSYQYKHLIKICEGNYNINWGTKWQNELEEKPLYSKSLAKAHPAIAAQIDTLTPQYISFFKETKRDILQLALIENIIKNLTPLSVIDLVYKEMEQIKLSQEIVPISDFNNLIYNEIKEQPTPFIYERLGERYQHFFIDEFQDTSKLQWENMIPLIDNALSQTIDKKESSLLIVGDVKQSIYRWRGGLPEQFASLITKNTPFNHIPEVANLPVNYRSAAAVIEFNNAFFSFVAPFFDHEQHQNLYALGNQQKTTHFKGGYVHLETIEKGTKEEKDESYSAKTIATIERLLQNGFQYGDICVLTRSKKDGVTLSTALMEAEIPVVSSETLLLKHAPIIPLLVGLLQLSVQPDDAQTKVAVLDYIYDHLSITKEKHAFFMEFLSSKELDFSIGLKNYQIIYDPQHIHQVSIYEAVEYIIQQFQLDIKADAYLYGFLDFVFDFETNKLATLLQFLKHWEAKKNKASIVTPKDMNGVQFMTIHKSKGLEFPVVIFPYADINIYHEREAKAWYEIDEQYDSNISSTLISYKADIKEYNPQSQQIVEARRQIQQLDTVNMLYVTLTRAVEQLYVFTEMPGSNKDGIKTYNHLFSEFLKKEGRWVDEPMVYSFGNFQKQIKEQPSKNENQVTTPIFISTPLASHNLQIIGTQLNSQQEAIVKGNKFHDIMEQINYHGDEDIVLQAEKETDLEGFKKIEKTIKAILYHPDLYPLFSKEVRVENEKDIITSKGVLLRPDRLVFYPTTQDVSIIDYKTGTPEYHHEDQIEGYANALKEMDYTIKDKILVYANNPIMINKL